MTSEPEESLPEEAAFNNMEESWETYKLLECFADGYGAWKVIDTLGKPIAELPEPMVSDLLTWRRLVGIAERVERKRKSKDEQRES